MARERTVLVMWEYGCDHSPVWGRSDDLDMGPVDVASLGASGALRDDLAGWNRAVQAVADAELEHTPVPDAPPRSVPYELAARLQRELGDAWTVWCLGGGGDGAMRDPGAFSYTRRFNGPELLLRGRSFADWTPGGSTDAAGALSPALQARVAALGEPVTAEARAAALELAAAITATLPEGRVLWFGGEDVP